MTALNASTRPAPDRELVDIADYVHDYAITDRKAIHAARLCTTDTLACALDALACPECTKHTFTAAQGSHPSDHLAGILMLADHLSRKRVAAGGEPLRMRRCSNAPQRTSLWTCS